MDLNYAMQIRKRVENTPDGGVLVNSDFSDITNSEITRRNLNRLVKSGILRRVINGVYEKPKFSVLLNEYVSTDPDAVANALARNFRWTISPSGNTALNMLGLSTQVPSTWTYVSDGPYKTYKLDSMELEFKHRTNREISGLSRITTIVVQALKALGRDNVTQDVVDVLSSRINDEDKRTLIDEAKESTDWVYDIIRKINMKRDCL